jgi:hypothetical protein
VNFSTSEDFTKLHSPPYSLASIGTENGSQIGSEFGNSGNKCEIISFCAYFAPGSLSRRSESSAALGARPQKAAGSILSTPVITSETQRLPKCVLLVTFFLRRPQALGSYQRFYQNEHNRICYDPRDIMALNEQRSNELCRYHGYHRTH